MVMDAEIPAVVQPVAHVEMVRPVVPEDDRARLTISTAWSPALMVSAGLKGPTALSAVALL